MIEATLLEHWKLANANGVEPLEYAIEFVGPLRLFADERDLEICITAISASIAVPCQALGRVLASGQLCAAVFSKWSKTMHISTFTLQIKEQLLTLEYNEFTDSAYKDFRQLMGREVARLDELQLLEGYEQRVEYFPFFEDKTNNIISTPGDLWLNSLKTRVKEIGVINGQVPSFPWEKFLKEACNVTPCQFASVKLPHVLLKDVISGRNSCNRSLEAHDCTTLPEMIAVVNKVKKGIKVLDSTFDLDANFVVERVTPILTKRLQDAVLAILPGVVKQRSHQSVRV